MTDRLVAPPVTLPISADSHAVEGPEVFAGLAESTVASAAPTTTLRSARGARKMVLK